MKNLFKIFASLLALIFLSISIVSCNIIGDSSTDTDSPPMSKPDSKPNHTHSYVDGKCDCGKTDPNYTATHEHSFLDGRCECGEVDPNYVPPHKHSFVEGKCECGEIDPSYVPPHNCANVCPECGLCLNSDCSESVCAEKCQGHKDINEIRYGYYPIISEKMPAIYINTPDGSNSWATSYVRNDKLAGNIDYVDATVSLSECDADYAFSDVLAEVKVRGNYTLDYEKKPIRIKFSEKRSVLGLHEGQKYKNWVLLADWKDLSMTNNTVAFYLGKTILGSDGYYCTDFRNVEVYLNGQYWGVYLLVEQQEAKDGRGGVPEVEDDYTGNDIGYFFEYDGYYTDEMNIPDGDPTFTVNHQGLAASSNGYTVKSDIYADSQLAFLKKYMNNAIYIAHQATKGYYYQLDENYNIVSAPANSNAKDIVGSVIDLQSLVDIYILNEIAKDLDVDWSSFYLSLDMTSEGNKKITFEAPWDFDSSFGLVNRDNCPTTSGLYAANDANPWFQLVKNEDWFWDMVYEKWAELKEYGVLDTAIKLVKEEKETYKEYYIKNYEKWSSRVIYGNGECVPQINSYKNIRTAQGLAADYLINWLSNRIAWLDGQWTVKEEIPEEEIPENAKSYLYEAEDARLIGFVSDAIRYNRDYASGNAYVGRVDNGTSLSFTVTAAEDCTAYLFAGISKRISARPVSEMFSVTVNGETVFLSSTILPAISDGEDDWHTFVSARIATIELSEGKNTIIFTTISSDATNFDFIEIYSTEELR